MTNQIETYHSEIHGSWEARSNDNPGIVGIGITEQEAINDYWSKVYPNIKNVYIRQTASLGEVVQVNVWPEENNDQCVS